LVSSLERCFASSLDRYASSFLRFCPLLLIATLPRFFALVRFASPLIRFASALLLSFLSLDSFLTRSLLSFFVLSLHVLALSLERSSLLALSPDPFFDSLLARHASLFLHFGPVHFVASALVPFLTSSLLFCFALFCFLLLPSAFFLSASEEARKKAGGSGRKRKVAEGSERKKNKHHLLVCFFCVVRRGANETKNRPSCFFPRLP